MLSGQDPNLATRNINEWFNTSVFSLAPAYTFGNAPRTLPNVRQSGLNTADLSLFKSFKIHERATLTFRARSIQCSQ